MSQMLPPNGVTVIENALIHYLFNVPTMAFPQPLLFSTDVPAGSSIATIFYLSYCCHQILLLGSKSLILDLELYTSFN